MMDKDILLFDLDGTLTDPKVGITRSVALLWIKPVFMWKIRMICAHLSDRP